MLQNTFLFEVYLSLNSDIHAHNTYFGYSHKLGINAPLLSEEFQLNTVLLRR